MSNFWNQAEYDELAQRVEALKEENALLREQLERTREECDKLSSENASLNVSNFLLIFLCIFQVELIWYCDYMGLWLAESVQEKLQNRVGQELHVDGVNGQPEAEPQVTANIDPTERDTWEQLRL